MKCCFIGCQNKADGSRLLLLCKEHIEELKKEDAKDRLEISVREE